LSLSPSLKRILRDYAWLFMQLVIIVILLGLAFDIATYFKHEWQFHYPGFSIFFNKDIPNSQLSVPQGFFHAAMLVLLYGVYVCLREISIKTILSTRQKLYNIIICNKVSTFILLYSCLLIFLWAFNIIKQQQVILSFCLYLPALFAMYIINVYWLFPMKGDETFFRATIIIRLLITSFVCALPLTFFIHEPFFITLLYSWAEQLFVVTPLTWWYFQANKNKILQVRVVETALVKTRADLQLLRSQINPHFLFNTLNTLYGTALQENAERTATGIQQLGDMMRFMLHENSLDFIDMNKEIDYLKNYITLQKLRTQSSKDITIEDNINEQNCNHRIAPMLLIPLVENAFKHGISLKEKSWIKIKLECTERNILFEVSNSVHIKTGDDPEKDKSGIGYKNVMERLKLIYEDRFQMSVNRDEIAYCVQLIIQPADQ
jgi:two-component system, LytTR family, sensor kinase